MRPNRSSVGAILVIVFILTFVASPTTAQSTSSEPNDSETNGTSTPSVGDGTVSVDLEVSVAGESVVGPGVPAWMRECRWQSMTRAQLFSLLDSTEQGTGQDRGGDPDEEWAVVLCKNGPEARAASPNAFLLGVTGIFGYWEVGERPPQALLDWLVGRAYSLVELPVQVGQGAPFGDEDAPLITQLPTWLWIEESAWAPQTASVEVFGVTASVTATPANVIFTGPDNETVDCGANTGPVYNFDLTEEEQQSDCVLTYKHSSSVGDWTLSSTVTWDVTYQCSAFCGSGVLPDLVIQNTREVLVAELQAILVNPDR